MEGLELLIGYSYYILLGLPVSLGIVALVQVAEISTLNWEVTELRQDTDGECIIKE